MTAKQARIVDAALTLFAQHGYHATSTSKVARAAGVSEGLIFRHFGSKEGLLRALLAEGEARAAELFATILTEKDPRAVIRKALELPFRVPEAEHEFWLLQFKIKWEIAYHNPETYRPLREVLERAFAQLNYTEPALEAEFLVHCIDGLSGAILKRSIEEPEALLGFMLRKYAV